MPTAFTHAFVGAALTPLAPKSLRRARVAALLAAVAVLPDLDVAGFALGIPYAHALGHRGFSHSIVFAAAVGLLLPAFAFRQLGLFTRGWWASCGVVFLACFSHGFLDAFTDAGLGVGFLLPFDESRYFFPWRPLLTSPLHPGAFFDARGLAILTNELAWVGLPVLLALILARVVGGARR